VQLLRANWSVFKKHQHWQARTLGLVSKKKKNKN
jgi:hypothetical protein